MLIALAALLSLSASAAAQTTNDYDSDNDGYIDVDSLAKLNAVRYDLNGDGARGTVSVSDWANYTAAFPNAASGMGCPSAGCVGYELTASLDLDSDSDGDVDASDHSGNYWDTGKGCQPIGSATRQYSGNFKGNGHTINNLFINSSGGTEQGLFEWVTGRIETMGVINASVSATTDVGILAGSNRGTIVACYTTGKVEGLLTNTYLGGLVRIFQRNRLHKLQHSIVTNSYRDIISSGCTSGGTNRGSGAVGKTPRQLQTVTSYTGIFANWNANLDSVAGNDDPWDFGNGMQYPMLDYDGMSTATQGGLAMGIPANWNAPIVGERVGVSLTAAAQSSRNGAWVWEKSTNGDTWDPISGPSFEYNPVAADAGSYLRAKAPLTGGSVAYTRILGGRVADSPTGSAVTFLSGNASPQVGTDIVATNPVPSGAVDARLGWQRCPNTASPHTDCVYIPSSWCEIYTPVAADVGNYLRMYVYYATSTGVWTRHETAFTGQVAASQ